MRKPRKVTTRQHLGVVPTLNSTLKKLPQAFAAGEKITETDLIDILASKAFKGHKKLMTDHGFDQQTAAKAELAEICKCVETKEALQAKHSTHKHCYNNDDSLQDNRPTVQPSNQEAQEEAKDFRFLQNQV
jgi:hypothetical protein